MERSTIQKPRMEQINGSRLLHSFAPFILFLTIGFQSFFSGILITPVSAIECSLIERKDSCEEIEFPKDPCVIVIFGVTGDLTARKLLPAIYHLVHDGNLPLNVAVVGVARSNHTHETFRTLMGEALDQYSREPRDVDFWNRFKDQIFYSQGDVQLDQSYENLKDLLLSIDQEFGTQGNRIYYFATQPSYFATIVKKLDTHRLMTSNLKFKENWSKIIIEKPFGYDLDSAMHLQNIISSLIDESQVYRMDHYLGKEGVQNIFTLRFETGLFEPLWNNKYIDNIQITLSEDIGIGSRARFWEETGSLRDVFQNHMMQLLSIVTMEPPKSLNAFYIHEAKLEVLNAIRSFQLDYPLSDVIRGQYSSGIIQGNSVPGYKQENGVAENSSAETFVAAKVFIDNPRWEKIPFYLRCGKRLAKQTSEIVVTFKNCGSMILNHCNALVIRIQPNAGIFLKTLSKVPMLNKQIKPIVFGYHPELFFDRASPEAYEKLLYDCIRGDKRFFVDVEEQLAAWRLLTPVLEHWKSKTHKEIPSYDAGTWGPSAADHLLEEGHRWQLLEH